MSLRSVLDGFFKPKNKYSVAQLQYLHNQLSRNIVVTEHNKVLIIETLRAIAEIVVWGDQNDPLIFESFLEKSTLYLFFDVLKQKTPKVVKCQLLQTLSIFLENLRTETSIYYILSNERINDIITHKFEFNDEEITGLYISFLKNLALKLNTNTVQFFFNKERENPLPLYLESIRFLIHDESMVRIAIRTLTLNVFKVDDDNVRSFLIHPRAAPFFLQFCWLLRKIYSQMTKAFYENAGGKLTDVMNELTDNIYYLNDVFLLKIPIFGETLGDYLLYYIFWQINLPSLISRGRLSFNSCPSSPESKQNDSPILRQNRSTSTPVLPGSPSISSSTNIPPMFSLASLCHFFSILSQPNLLNFLAMTLFHVIPPRLPTTPLPATIDTTYQHPEISAKSIYIHELFSGRRDELRNSGMNQYRNAIVSHISSHDDRLSLGAVLLLATIVTNTSIHPSVLRVCGLYPQRLRIQDESNVDSNPPQGHVTVNSLDEIDIEFEEDKKPIQAAVEVLGELRGNHLGAPKLMRSLSVCVESHDIKPIRRKASASSIFQSVYMQPDKQTTPQTLPFIEGFFAYATKVESRTPLDYIGLTPELIKQYTPEGEERYSEWLVSLLLPIFSSPRSLPLLQVTELLLNELVYHENHDVPLLEMSHMSTLEHLYEVILSEFRFKYEKMHNDVCVPILEDEFSQLKDIRLESTINELWSMIKVQGMSEYFDENVGEESVEAFRKLVDVICHFNTNPRFLRPDKLKIFGFPFTTTQQNFLIFRRIWLRFHRRTESLLPFPQTIPPYRIGEVASFR